MYAHRLCLCICLLPSAQVDPDKDLYAWSTLLRARNREEAAPRGIKWYGSKSRIQILEETIQILKELWTKEESYFTGKYFQLNKANCIPKPIQKPHPPITIASWGEKLGLKSVARYADRSNFGLIPLDMMEHKLKVLEKHCESVGRDYESIIKSAEIGVILHPNYDEYIARAPVSLRFSTSKLRLSSTSSSTPSRPGCSRSLRALKKRYPASYV